MKLKRSCWISAIAFALLLFAGCGTENNQADIEVDSSAYDVVLALKKQHLYSGETEHAVLSLKHDESMPAGSGDNAFSVTLGVSDAALVSVVPQTCELSNAAPECDVQITSKHSPESRSRNASGTETEIYATYGDKHVTLATISHVAISKESRVFSFVNQCPFDVWVGTSGASASQIACTPQDPANTGGYNPQDFQASCPESTQICMNFSGTKNYCVYATVNAAEKPTAPIKAQETATYSLSTSACQGGMVTDIGSAVYGQCECRNDDDCGAGQKCKPSAGTNQCQWSLDLSDFGKIPHGAKTPVTVALEHPSDSRFAASGAMYIKLGCDASGQHCLSDNQDPSLNSPTTFIEYTLATSDNDFYDVSNINGATVPVTMKPIVTTQVPIYSDDSDGQNSFANNPYWCSVAAGTRDEFSDQIKKIKATFPNYSPQNTLGADYGCKNNYNDALDPGFVFVSPEGNTTHTCTSDADCSGRPEGPSCGLSSNVMNNNLDGNNTLIADLDRSEHYQCGHIIGYASLTQLCGLANESNASLGYLDSRLKIDCSIKSDDTIDFTNYALCETKLLGSSDTGPARSCFNANQTASGDTCCGYSSWNGQPTGESKGGRGDGSAVKDVNTTFWAAHIEPFIAPIKENCPTAYSYQYDDPFSTFTCRSKAASDQKNYLSYQITLCDGNRTGGVSLPAAVQCALDPKYPASPANAVFVPAPGKAFDESNESNITFYNVAVYGCSSVDACDENNLSKSGGGIYGDNNASFYYVLGQNPHDDTFQGCMFKAAEGTCLSLAQSAYNSVGCESWPIVKLEGNAFNHRQIGMPAFTNGSKSNPFVSDPF